MKLRNKKTGEIVEQVWWDNEVDELCINGNKMYFYNSLAELNEEWEDYDENKYYYAITSIKADAGITKMKNIHNGMTAFDKSIGNYFETKEEAEKAVEKLKAWKRLKDYYIKFRLDFVKNTIIFTYRLDGTLHSAINEERIIFEDMKTIFGGNDESSN